ncbi:hypothetical protein AAFN86_28755 [Roseomonas sp. CAU 1739]|uniref:hypothetical protein n=1 Tax=Roseomonas sp. CAU 1739 TaxID=3140364 RepID=UPI00325BFE14
MRPLRRAATTARRPATGPAQATATAPMGEERRKALALSRHPGRDRAIGLAFWAGFAVLVLHYLGVIPLGQPTAADIWPPPRPVATAPR